MSKCMSCLQSDATRRTSIRVELSQSRVYQFDLLFCNDCYKDMCTETADMHKSYLKAKHKAEHYE